MKNYNVLLIAIYSAGMSPGFEEIGICSITAFIREKGYPVMLLGVKEDEIDYQQIVNYQPKIIGMSVYTRSKKAVYQFCQKIRQDIPDIYLCAGGYLPTYYGPEMLEENPDLDFAIRGEGELVFLELLSRLEKGDDLKGLPGLTYRHENKIIVNEPQLLIEDLNTLPFPSRDILKQNKLRIAQLSNSRGCSGRCTFCCSPTYWKNNGHPKWRGRSITKTVDEIEFITTEYGVKGFFICDGSFEDPGSNYQRVWNFADEILKRNLNIAYFLSFRSEFHRKLTPELLDLLKKSGLCNVFIGIESANEFDLRLYGKTATMEDNIKMIELFRNAQIHINIGFISFNPYSTFERLRNNIDFLEKYGFASDFLQIYPVRIIKGTALYSKIEQDGLLTEGAIENEFRYKYLDERIGLLVFSHLNKL